MGIDSLILHPNEGVVLLGIVQIILGLSFIAMTFFDRKSKSHKHDIKPIQKILPALAFGILIFVFFVVSYYLDLPQTEASANGNSGAIVAVMGFIAIIYTFIVEDNKVEKKTKRDTLYTFLTGKKVSYFHMSLVGVGIVFICLGFSRIFI